MSAPSDAVFHLGAHKTGTTVIQSALRHHRDALRAAGIGFLDPRHPVFDEMALGPITQRLASGRPPGDLYDAFSTVVDAARGLGTARVVVSHEGLLGPQLPRPGFAEGMPLYGSASRLLEALAEAAGPARAVIYIRGQAGFLRSQYSQWLKRGIPLDFEDWLAMVDLESLSWRPLVAAAAAAFGAGNLLVKAFQLSAIGLDRHVAEFFEEVVGTAVPAGELEVRNPNRTLSVTGIRVARALADVPLERADRHAVAAFLARRFAMSPDRDRFDPLDEATKNRLRDLYDAENSAIVAEYGGPGDRGRPVL